jgi:hypothetical protein
MEVSTDVDIDRAFRIASAFIGSTALTCSR